MQKRSDEFDDTRVFKKATEIYSRANLDGTVTILRLDDTKGFYSLDGVSAEFWSLVDEKSSLGEIKKKISKKHVGDEVCFDSSFKSLIQSLKKAKLIV